MGSNVPLASGDNEIKQQLKDGEYESLLDINEKQDVYPADKLETLKDESPDVEAQHLQSEEPLPKAPRTPLSREEALALRIRPLDNIRTIALSLILLQNVAIQAVSTHPHVSELQETFPNTFVLISLFVGLTRLLAVPLLFFVAGFASHFAMVMHTRSPIDFVIRRTWKAVMTVIFYQGTAYLAKNIRPLPPIDAPATTPYYASREGIEALLNGPSAYIAAALALDYVHAIFRALNAFISHPNKPSHYITTKHRYSVVKVVLFIFVECWVAVCSVGYSRRIIPAGSTAERWLYAVNSAELHFPFLYLIAYTAGVQFVHYYEFILATAQRKGGFSPSSTLFIRIILVSSSLYYIRHAFSGMVSFLDVRQRPTFFFAQPQAAPIYSIWVMYVLSVIPEAIISIFFTSRSLAADWGNSSRHAHLQVYVQMLFVVGNPIHIFDNLFWRWVFVGWMSIAYAKYIGIGAVMVGNLAGRGWSAMRRRISGNTQQPLV